MTEQLIERQRLLDRLNHAEGHLRQANRDRLRAEEQEEYWRKQIAAITVQLEQYQTE